MSRQPIIGLVLASRNSHKAQELSELIGGQAVLRCVPREITMPEVVEDAPTFEGNALKKADAIARWLAESPTLLSSLKNGSPLADWAVLADDSGLEVDALNGAPGVYSARFAGLDTGAPGNSPDADNNAKLMRLISTIPEDQLTARFRCVLAVVPIGGAGWLQTAMTFDGRCEGSILKSARGGQGFGYDPYFVPNGHSQTFAQLGAAEKNRLSHRARAAEAFRAWLAGATIN